ncbi:MAG: hypothetical protein WCS37_01310 [Chloroflexota bacterium]|nr:hypothetical protein [Chloroflexota bacterium]
MVSPRTSKSKDYKALPPDELLAQVNSSPTLLGMAVGKQGTPILHRQVALIEFANAQVMEEVLQSTDLKNFVVRRLGDTVLMIDHERREDLVKLLTKRGYEPRILTN